MLTTKIAVCRAAVAPTWAKAAEQKKTKSKGKGYLRNKSKNVSNS